MQLLEEMLQKGVRVSEFGYNTAINALVKAGEVDRAFDVIADMKHAGE